jgi:hypothetical protein
MNARLLQQTGQPVHDVQGELPMAFPGMFIPGLDLAAIGCGSS